MVIVFYTLAVLTGLASGWCAWLAADPVEAFQHGTTHAVAQLQFVLFVLTMVVCLATASLLQRLDALRQDRMPEAHLGLPRR